MKAAIFLGCLVMLTGCAQVFDLKAVPPTRANMELAISKTNLYTDYMKSVTVCLKIPVKIKPIGYSYNGKLVKTISERDTEYLESPSIKNDKICGNFSSDSYQDLAPQPSGERCYSSNEISAVMVPRPHAGIYLADASYENSDTCPVPK